MTLITTRCFLNEFKSGPGGYCVISSTARATILVQCVVHELVTAKSPNVTGRSKKISDLEHQILRKYATKLRSPSANPSANPDLFTTPAPVPDQLKTAYRLINCDIAWSPAATSKQ